ncbi:sensor histidine kinase, PAS, PAS and PAS domain-containing [Syntrophotalea carbinolica DSM 2380]|uniref:histidine kinase n=1 Tax=Syntrophotalea carbinolica (strain DSM 2380 / NBRC 103641 / GraBd1) TaxID=338963 RepID=Q3A2Z1_SYNC1|nr:PAS domain S-box protein [Syntrophotalea carbinolica]ABA89266.1 sensor histidine kinase, PAS, PAS and PAS domain-containing [Syntrophotalea carbinolica DSM 2380]
MSQTCCEDGFPLMDDGCAIVPPDLTLKKYQALAEAFGGVVYELNHPGGRLDWSDQCWRMFGITREEMGSDIQSWLVHIHPEDRTHAFKEMHRTLRSGQPTQLEYRVQHRDGHYVWVQDYSYVCCRGANDVCHIVGYLQNISDTKKHLNDLDLARRAIDSSINAIAFTDLEGCLSYVNRSFVRMMGIDKPETAIGRQVGTLWKNPKKARVVLRNLQKFGEWSGEVAALRPDGLLAYFEVSAHVVEDSGGHPHCYMASFVDVTEQKKAEQEVQESEEKYRLLFSSCSDAIVIFDAGSLRIVDVNGAALDLYGYTRDEFLALDVLDLSEEPEQSRLRMQQIISGTLRHFPLVSHRRKDGTRVDVEVSVGSFSWQKRQVFAGFFRDVSERQRIEELKDDMLSSVSHEMRTPLTAIMGFTDYLLKSNDRPERQKDYLSIIQQQSERLKELVENHLNLQRLRAGHGVGAIHPVEVLPLLHGVSNMFSSARGRDRIRIQCPEDLPPVRGDENQLYRALYNLLSNAIKYSSEDQEILLGARRADDAAVLFVKDQGVGIPNEHQATIFDRFFRVPAGDHGMRGSGLGLSLVQEIIKAHNGRIWLDSVPGQGSCFYLKLPLFG